MNPIRGSLQYPAVTLSLTLGLLLLGTQAILHMPRMEDPSVTIRTGIVAALYPGATPPIRSRASSPKKWRTISLNSRKFARRRRIRPAGPGFFL